MGPLNLWQKTVIVALSLLALARVSGARDAEETVLTLAGARKVAAAAGEAKTADIRP